jgi:hypothetical protein
MQYTKTLAGYHGPNHDGDAIVIGCRSLEKQRQAGIFVRQVLSCSARADGAPR